jgi:hypothetical protein
VSQQGACSSSLPSLIIICNLTTQLDTGTEEKIMLVARDEQSCLVVSYKDIKQCIESAFVYVFFVAWKFRFSDSFFYSELALNSSSAKQRSGYR